MVLSLTDPVLSICSAGVAGFVRARRSGIVTVLVAAAAWSLLTMNAAAASLDAPGTPLIQTFSAEEGYRLQGRFNTFAQDVSGTMFMTDRARIVSFDGERFEDVGVPDGRYHHVAVDWRDRVYYAGYNRIGYLTPPDEAGGRRVVDLLNRLPESLADDVSFRHVERLGEGMLFLGRRHFIRLDGDDRVTHVLPLPAGSRGFTSLEASNGRLFINVSDVGIVEIVGGEMQKLPGSEWIAGHYNLREMIHLGADSLFIVSEDRGLYIYDSGRSTRLRGPLSDYADEYGAMGAVQLDDGLIAIATYRGGVAIGSMDGRLHKLVTKEFGLASDNSVGGIFLDREDGLWVSTFEGINRIVLSTGFTLFNEAYGLDGVVMDVARVGGDLFVGTTISAYWLRPGTGRQGAARFVDLTGVHGSVVSLLPMNNSLYAASNVKMHRLVTRPPAAYEVRQGEQTGALAAAATADGARAFVIQETDIFVYQTWGRRSMSIVDTLRFPQPSVPIDALCRGNDELWITRNSGDLTSRAFTRFVIDPDDPLYGAAVDFGPGEGLPAAGPLVPFLQNGELMLGTRYGFLRYRPESSGFAADSSLNAAASPHGISVVHAAADERGWVWYVSENGFAHGLAPGPDGYRHVPLPRVSQHGEIRSFEVDPDGSLLWIGLSTGELLRYETGAAGDPEEPLPPLLRQVAHIAETVGAETDSVLYGGLHPAGLPKRGIPTRHSHLRFHYALPAFNSLGRIEYRTRLVGFNDTWSPWTATPVRDYTSLLEGKYVFEVQARDRLGQLSPVTQFPFTVIPPWWRTIWVGLFIAAAVFGFYYLVVWWRDRRARARQQELEELVELRSDELASSREQEMLLQDEVRRWTEQARLAVTIARDVNLPLSDIDKMLKGIYYAKNLNQGQRIVLVRVKQALDHIRNSLARISRVGGRLPEPDPGSHADLALVEAVPPPMPAALAPGHTEEPPPFAGEAQYEDDPMDEDEPFYHAEPLDEDDAEDEGSYDTEPHARTFQDEHEDEVDDVPEDDFIEIDQPPIQEPARYHEPPVAAPMDAGYEEEWDEESDPAPPIERMAPADSREGRARPPRDPRPPRHAESPHRRRPATPPATPVEQDEPDLGRDEDHLAEAPDPQGAGPRFTLADDPRGGDQPAGDRPRPRRALFVDRSEPGEEEIVEPMDPPGSPPGTEHRMTSRREVADDEFVDHPDHGEYDDVREEEYAEDEYAEEGEYGYQDEEGYIGETDDGVILDGEDEWGPPEQDEWNAPGPDDEPPPPPRRSPRSLGIPLPDSLKRPKR